MLEYVALTAAGEGYGEVDEAGASECESDIDGDDAGRMNRLDEQIEFNQGYSYSRGRRRSTGSDKMRYHTYHRGLYLPNKAYGMCKPGATVGAEKVDELLAGVGFDVEKYNKEFPVVTSSAAALTNKRRRRRT